MTERLWIFPAILCLLLSITFSEVFSIFGLILSVIWFVRILCLKHRPILVLSAIIGILFIGTGYIHNQLNMTKFSGNEENFILYPEMTTIKVDGNKVRFAGVAYDESFAEQLVVSYYLESEEDKNLWLESPPNNHLLIEGELTIPAEGTNFNQFNYRQYLKRHNTHWELEAKSIQRLNRNKLEKPINAYVENVRHTTFQYVDRLFHPKIASYLKTLLFSDKRGFSEEMLQNYRSLGVVHLFSISGFHISYLMGILRKLLLRLGITHERTNILLIVILPFYGCLAGLGVSVFRAVVQNILVLLGKLRNKPLDTIDAWALTMLFALFVNPGQVYNISFQLSYMLSGIFILIGKQKWINELNPLTYSMLFSLMSGIASIPVLSYHFFEIFWVTALANLLFIPFFSNVLFPLLLLLFLSSFLLSEFLLFSFMEQIILFVIQFVEQILSLLTTTFNFSFVTGRLPAVVMLILIISIFSVLRKIEMKQAPRMISLLFIGLSLFYYQLSPIGYVVLLDVGQGDSIIIKDPITRKITLIDTGGRLSWGSKEKWKEPEKTFSVGADIVVPSLKSLGISTIDRLFLSHADADHSGEIRNIAHLIPINEIAATTNTFYDPLIYKQIIPLKNTKRVAVTPPEILNYPIKETLAIHPKSNTVYQDNNNQSLVLYVTLGEDKWLFTGDVEKEAERQIVQEYGNLKVDYLKVSHHGSQTSSTEEFINHVEPKAAFISVGADNQFGHPHADVIARFKKNDIDIYSTSLEGAIMHRYLKIPFTTYWFSDLQTVHKN